MKKINYNSICFHSKLLTLNQWHFCTKKNVITLNINGKPYTFSTNNNEVLKHKILQSEDEKVNTGDGTVIDEQKD